MTPITALAARTAVAAFVAVSTLGASTNNAGAASLAVKMACANDYHAHCSQHAPDSPGVRKCMRAVGKNLSKGCIDALAGAGQGSKSVVAKKVAAK